MGAATDNLESDKYISAQKDTRPECISAVYSRTPVTRTFQKEKRKIVWACESSSYRGRYKIQKNQFAMLKIDG